MNKIDATAAAGAIHKMMNAEPDDTSFDRKPEDLQSVLDVHANSTPENWTQARINRWQDSVFGNTASVIADGGVMDKLMEEVHEVDRSVHAYQGEQSPENMAAVAEELADLQLMLYHLAGRLSIDVQRAVNEKMRINAYEREWDVNNSGSGAHRK